MRHELGHFGTRFNAPLNQVDNDRQGGDTLHHLRCPLVIQYVGL